MSVRMLVGWLVHMSRPHFDFHLRIQVKSSLHTLGPSSGMPDHFTIACSACLESAAVGQALSIIYDYNCPSVRMYVCLPHFDFHDAGNARHRLYVDMCVCLFVCMHVVSCNTCSLVPLVEF